MTEAAALAAGALVGRGDKEAADQAAVDGMHAVLHTIHMDGIVVIGEGEKDEAPMLANGEQVGDGSDAAGRHRRRPARGHAAVRAAACPNALAVIALAERGTMFDPGPCVYMEKMAGGDDIADLLDLDRPLGETIGLVAERKGIDVGDVMVVVLDRPRHEEGIKAIREAGARVRLITDGDVSGALLAVSPDARPSTCCGASAARPRASSPRPRIKCMRRRADRPPVAARRRRAQGGRGRRLRRRRACSPTTTSSRATTASSPPPASPTATCSQGVRYQGARGAIDRVAGHAHALGHGAPDPRRATTATSCGR